ncbi:MAG: hypothetical protein RL026_1582 [Pseudomonadota bacterium]|jgi:hypothetical protein
MRRLLPQPAGCLLLLAFAATPAVAGDPVVTDSRIITEERRLALLETKLSSLRLQVERLEDRRAIDRLQQVYTHYITAGRPREAAALFSRSPEATIEYAQRGVYVGRARIQAFLERVATLQPGEIRETPTFQGVITVAPDGRSARGRWRSLVMAGRHGEDGRWIEGPYENEYVKEDGVWRIKALHWFTTVQSSYDKGWNKGWMPADGPLPDLPPDRPPSIAYQSFPKFFLPPYHYANPVTGKPAGWDP